MNPYLPTPNRPEEPTTKPTKEELDTACTQISRLSPQVQTNPQVKAVIENYWANFPAALERLKIAVEENWRCNLTGVLVKALKEGVPSEDAAPPCTFFGWKEWADEAIRRQLMEYSSSYQGDILVHLVGGVSSLWSQLRCLSWSEIEIISHLAPSPSSCETGILVKLPLGRTLLELNFSSLKAITSKNGESLNG